MCLCGLWTAGERSASARLWARCRRWLQVRGRSRGRGQWRSDVGAVPGRPAASETPDSDVVGDDMVGAPSSLDDFSDRF